MRIALACLAAFAAVAALAAPASAVEEPAFETLVEDGDFTLRRYPALVVAEVVTTGERSDAISRGFRPLFDYISGANAPGEKIAMTAPVTQETGEEIAMTAPVTQEAGTDGQWRVHFIMPAGRTLADLPKPTDPRVTLREIPARTVAAVRFSGFATQGSIAEEEAALAAWIAAKGFAPQGAPVYAFYDPPFTLPFFRRNEVMVPVAAPAAGN